MEIDFEKNSIPELSHIWGLERSFEDKIYSQVNLRVYQTYQCRSHKIENERIKFINQAAKFVFKLEWMMYVRWSNSCATFWILNSSIMFVSVSVGLLVSVSICRCVGLFVCLSITSKRFWPKLMNYEIYPSQTYT